MINSILELICFLGASDLVPVYYYRSLQPAGILFSVYDDTGAQSAIKHSEQRQKKPLQRGFSIRQTIANNVLQYTRLCSYVKIKLCFPFETG